MTINVPRTFAVAESRKREGGTEKDRVAVHLIQKTSAQDVTSGPIAETAPSESENLKLIAIENPPFSKKVLLALCYVAVTARSP